MTRQKPLPRLIRLRDAPDYLGMDKNRFNQEVRPNIPAIPIGKTGIAFDRLDLDNWAEQTKQRMSRLIKNKRGKLWAKNDTAPDSSSAVSTGILTSSSLDSEYEALQARSNAKLRKPSSLAESKRRDKR